MARKVASFALDIKAEDLVILDMRKAANFCDYFVLCTGNSSRQVRAIAEEIEEKLHDCGLKVKYRQGQREGKWILLDMGNVIAHIFDPETRNFYRLDYLWKEAKNINL